MMPTDTLTCQITPDSVEPTSLSCSVPPLEALDLWSTAGSIATAIFTLVLAIFAIAAWRSSVRNIQAMDRHNQDSIRASQELSVQSRQIQFLAEYCNALMDLSNAAGNHKANLEPLLETATAKWATWAMELFRIDPEFREMTGKWNTVMKDNCEALHTIVSRESMSGGMSLTKIESHDSVRTQVGWYFAKLQVWQADPTRRDEVKQKLAENYHRANK